MEDVCKRKRVKSKKLIGTKALVFGMVSNFQAGFKHVRIKQPGLTQLHASQSTASVFINDDESGLHHDYEVWLEELVPHEPLGQYWHNRTGEDNTDAHLKRQEMGCEVIVAIINGKLDFGPWEQIFYGEFNGQRQICMLESYQDARKI